MNITLDPSGAFALTLPSGRTITIPVTPHAADFLAKVLYDAEHDVRDQRGYIGAYPTQAIADAWMRQAANKDAQAQWLEEQRIARKQELEAEVGINIDALEITL